MQKSYINTGYLAYSASEMQKSYINTGYLGFSASEVQKSYINTGYSGISGFAITLDHILDLNVMGAEKPEIPE